MNFKIVFEDDYILVVNKPAGLVVNKSQTSRYETLQDELSLYFGLKEGDLGIGDRSGIVHRLDRETSGLLIVAKTKSTFESLQEQFKSRKVKKHYKALVHGHFNVEEGAVESKIVRISKFGKFGIADDRSREGREAITNYVINNKFNFDDSKFAEILEVLGGEKGLTKSRINYLKQNAKTYSMINVFPKTGRTHQIRVHLKSIGHPIVSDLIYGPGKLLKFDLIWCPRLFLHAAEIKFLHPKTKKEINFECPIPADVNKVLGYLVK